MTDPTPSHEQHRRAADDAKPIRIAVVTVSDSRTETTDLSGQYLRQAIVDAGHVLEDYRIIPDEQTSLVETLEALARGRAQAIVYNDGTGISSRDRTYDSLSGQLETTLPGFGELFRMLSWQQVGSAAMLSRAIAGTVGSCLVFATPGSPKAVQLAWDQLIEPELRHMIWELGR